MKGQVLNQIDNIVSVQIVDDYQFDEFEPVTLDTLKVTFLDELRGLYWLLLDWMVISKNYLKLPNASRWFRRGESVKMAKEKLYAYSRFVADWLVVGYDKNGCQQIEPKSTDSKSISQQQFSELYGRTYDEFAKVCDMTPFNKQHQLARDRIGKEF